jgi:large subunit ribosomal protein L4
MQAKVLSTEGKELRTIEVSDRVFNRTISEGAIYYAVQAELNNRRVGTAKAKTRGEVVGSRKKPWRQKGTGRARVGSRQNPVWVGGGVAFGPQPRSYSVRIPRKQKRAGMMSVLSMKMQEGVVTVVEDFNVESGKTRDLVRVLKNLVPEERTMLLLPDADSHLVKRAARNVPWLQYASYNRMSAKELFYSRHIVVTESAATALGELYGEG